MIIFKRLCQKLLNTHIVEKNDKLNVKLLSSLINKTPCKYYSKKTSEEMKYLNVAEKHDAAKNIANILSNGSARRREGLCVYNKVFDFEVNVRGQNCKMVMTSVSGHLLNFEFLASYKGWNNCSPDQLFDAPIRKNISNKETGEKIKKTIEREIRGCQGLIIWTDCDREGENIGFEIIEVCQALRSNLKVYRAKFSEITRTGIFRAVNNLATPDQRQNEAVNIRQELDLRTGAAFTRYQTMRLQKLFPQTTAQKLISYGSCQIPTLGFVAERYKEVEEFVSEPFWKLKVIHTIEDLNVEFNWARNRLFNKEAVEDYLLLCLADPKAKVENKTVKPKSKWRPQPMDTVELEKLGSRKLKINAKEIMNIAEKLYNKGFISYPRTETNSFSNEINLRGLVEQHTAHPDWGAFSSRVLEWGPNPRNGKKTDEAHPPIHPTKLATGLNGDEARVYELIVRHFLACVSKDATGQETIVYIDIAGEKFSANGLVIYERNYLDVYPYEKWNAKQIHHYEINQIFEPTEISMQEGATTAPPLLTEADLIALMEKHGIGTDATHAEHIHTIKERGYIGEIERGLLVPGTIGMGLYEGYGAMDLELAKPRLRAEFESDLKKVCNGEKSASVVLREQIVKYKEAYHLITQRINAMDEKFGLRVNETPSNRRNNDDPGGGGGGGGGGDANRFNRRNNGGNSSGDDDDDHNNGNPPPGGAGVLRNDQSNDGIPQSMQEVFPCPKCKIGQMALKKKKDGIGFMIGCCNFPDCKNVIWLPDAIKQAQSLQNYCKKCGNKTNPKSLSKQIEFKFKNNSYLAMLCSIDPTYTTCIRCDSKFREIFDINLDQVKYAGSIVSDASHAEFKNTKTVAPKETARSTETKTKKSAATKSSAKDRTQKAAQKPKSRNFSSNIQPDAQRAIVAEENFDWVFDEAENLFENDGFDDELDKVLSNLSNSHPSTSWNRTVHNAQAKEVRIPNPNIDSYFTSWGTAGRNSLNNSSSNQISTSREPESRQFSSNKWFGGENKSPKEYRQSSKWVSLDEPARNNANSSFNAEGFDENEPQVKCSSCNKLTLKKITRKQGPNTGREFYTCEENCKFFKWADELTKTINHKPAPPKPPQWGNAKHTTISEQCDCPKPAVQLQVRKDGPNKGRFFFGCCDRICGFFKWSEDSDSKMEGNRADSANSWGTNKPTKRQKPNNDDDGGGGGGGPKKRKCGLCRNEGHTKNKCPRKEEFGGY